MLEAVLTGISLSLLNLIIAIIVIKISIRKQEWGKFIKIYGISAIVRFLLLIAAVYYFTAVIQFPKLAFILSLFISYIIFLAVEIFYLNSKKTFINFAPKKHNKAK